jgi:hypothetical protein
MRGNYARPYFEFELKTIKMTVFRSTEIPTIELIELSIRLRVSSSHSEFLLYLHLTNSSSGINKTRTKDTLHTRYIPRSPLHIGLNLAHLLGMYRACEETRHIGNLPANGCRQIDLNK